MIPLQEKLEDWKKVAYQMDKDHAKGFDQNKFLPLTPVCFWSIVLKHVKAMHDVYILPTLHFNFEVCLL